MARKLLAPFLLAACAVTPAAPPPAPTLPPSAGRDFDGDGFPDPRDRCPRDPGEGPVGCPNTDDDGDGLKAGVDRCPQQAGPAPDGCPPPDGDRDRVADGADRCPAELEEWNGFQDADGCPDQVPEDLVAFTGPIKGVQFEAGKPALKRGAKPALDRAAEVLRRHPDVRVEITDHTDHHEDAAAGQDPSRARAEVVKEYLVGRGIDPQRLETRGAAELEPIDTNKTAAGRARNRRIEFTIIIQ